MAVILTQNKKILLFLAALGHFNPENKCKIVGMQQCIDSEAFSDFSDICIFI